jgi:hypothetical protein
MFTKGEAIAAHENSVKAAQQQIDELHIKLRQTQDFLRITH